MKKSIIITFLTLFCIVSAPSFAEGVLAGLEKGDIVLESIGPINFGPEGLLFIADPKASTIYAVDSQDRSPAPAERTDVQGLDAKIASLLGTSREEVLVNDFALNPISGNAYLSVSRGRGPDAQPVLMRVTTSGELAVVELDDVAHSKASLWAAPDKDRRGRDIRQDAITEIAYVDGQVVVAGLSNQEFSSRLRVLNFPFTEENWDRGVEIYHTSHGQWETHSPIRTFTPFLVDEEPYILAAHTCTPLVRIPVSEIVSSDQKVVGTTIAELGNRNRPLDMLVYTKEGQDYLLITNSSRGVMKLAMASMHDQDALTSRVPDTAGAEIVPVDAFKGAVQVEPWGADKAVVLLQNDEGALALKTLALP